MEHYHHFNKINENKFVKFQKDSNKYNRKYKNMINN
jgi:hypothetical protein